MLSKTRTVLLAISIAVAFVVWGALISLQPPFYPSEAEKKGATPSQYGFVFGIMNLAAFISSPIFGAYGEKIGAKLLYNSGSFLEAICGILFAFLEYVPNIAAFIGLSYLLRFIGGVSEAAAWTSLVSILMVLYPKKVATVMSWTQMFFGFGYMIGPAVGSFLYSVGGFPLPFLVIGILALICAIMLFFVIPNVQSDKRDTYYSSDNVLTQLEVIKSPSILLPYVDAFLCSCGIGMIESMLEPHLKRKAAASQTDVGMTFFILGGVYMISSVIVGLICDRLRYPTVVSICGNALLAITFLFIGPVPFIYLETKLSVIQGMAGLAGFGYALLVVSSFSRSQKAALALGYRNDISTYIVISGMWSAAFYLGNFIGPTVSGISIDAFGFEWTTTILFGVYIFILIVDLLELFYNSRTQSICNSFKTTRSDNQNTENLPLMKGNIN